MILSTRNMGRLCSNPEAGARDSAVSGLRPSRGVLDTTVWLLREGPVWDSLPNIQSVRGMSVQGQGLWARMGSGSSLPSTLRLAEDEAEPMSFTATHV